MHKVLVSFLGGISLFLLAASSAQALDFKNGTYVNLCGSGTQATENTCDRGCNTETGTCSANDKFVVKYTCDGKLTECNQRESSFAKKQSIGNQSCGKTIQMIVFNKTCRNRGQWSCNQDNVQDYMVWYSGDCPARGPSIFDRFFPRRNSSPTPTRTPTPFVTPNPTPGTHTSRCESLQVTGGNDSQVPATITLRARAEDNRGPIQKYRFYFGDGVQVESDSPEVQHKYDVSGRFKARVDIRDSAGNWRTSSACEAEVRIKSSPLESAKSGCSDINVSATNNAKAPSTVTVDVNGFDNKGDLREYRVDFGNGVIRDNTSSRFEHLYQQPGTFTVRGYVKNSRGDWVGGTDACRQTLYISGDPLTKQPDTGTPTLLSILGIGSGLGGTALHFFKRRLNTTPT